MCINIYPTPFNQRQFDWDNQLLPLTIVKGCAVYFIIYLTITFLDTQTSRIHYV